MTNIQDMKLTRADLVAIYNTFALKAGKKAIKDFKSKDEARERIRAIAPAGELVDCAPGDAQVDPSLTQALQGVAPLRRGEVPMDQLGEWGAVVTQSDAPVPDDGTPCVVMLYNNANTAQWHVERVLENVFKFADADEDKAWRLMYEAHEAGKSIVFEGSKAECEEKLGALTVEIEKIAQSKEERNQYIKELTFKVEAKQ